jgi:Uma2 family endonuclease
VGHAWLIDPEQNTLEVFRLEQGRWVLVASHQGDADVRAEPFGAVPLSLGALWVPGPDPDGA